jgi:hypothetical protein
MKEIKDATSKCGDILYTVWKIHQEVFTSKLIHTSYTVSNKMA